ncbi:acyl-CoA dehydrogenase family protein [Gulosibacter faecalis]|uniref:Acyl-CoA dehydrogenase family protein n=1 Tax=Gulosibacter faecalis TaxID=272240 RepID=A0ABW5V273_9MICO|nr:acyl-CoA dehydrogenase family protein [Gulosibacter faecalis]
MPTTPELLARFAPVFAAIADGALERERERALPVAEVRALAEAGFGRVRLPESAGGFGATVPQLAALLVELAAADSNLAQIWRGHIAFVEDVLLSRRSEFRARWLDRIAAGAVLGNAWSEIGTVERGRLGTKIDVNGDEARVTGEKFYTTGSIYADYSDTTVEAADGTQYIAVVPLAQGGVTISDDWDGFGQQLTGTGTIVFDGATLDAADVVPFADRFPYQTALYQLVLLATHAGIARAVLRDASTAVAARERTYSHGNADRVRNDPQILQAVGELGATSYASDAIVQRVAESVQAAYETADAVRGGLGGDAAVEAAHDAVVASELDSARAQVTLSRLVPEAATRLFDSLGASGVRASAALDRHWRNARTVASHNPWLYKARTVGDFEVNGTEPGYQWTIGTVAATTPAAP